MDEIAIDTDPVVCFEEDITFTVSNIVSAAGLDILVDVTVEHSEGTDGVTENEIVVDGEVEYTLEDPAAGIYTVTFEAYNEILGCYTDVYTVVEVRPDVPDVVYNDTYTAKTWKKNVNSTLLSKQDILLII